MDNEKMNDVTELTIEKRSENHFVIMNMFYTLVVNRTEAKELIKLMNESLEIKK